MCACVRTQSADTKKTTMNTIDRKQQQKLHDNNHSTSVVKASATQAIMEIV